VSQGHLWPRPADAALRHRGRQVRAALDGRLVPAHLIGNAPNPPTLKVNFSQHSELNVRFQSHRSRRARGRRDSFRPLQLYDAAPSHSRAPAAAAQGLHQRLAAGGAVRGPQLGAGRRSPGYSCRHAAGEQRAAVRGARPRLDTMAVGRGPAERPAKRGAAAQVDNQAYPVTVDALHTVFSPYGFVQKIAIFDKNGTSQARPAAARRLRARGSLAASPLAQRARRRRAGAGAVPGPGQRGQCQGRAGGARHL